MDDYAEVRSVKVLHELGLTEDMVRDHVIRPEHVNAATLRIELRDAGDGDDDPSNPPLSGLFYSLNVQKIESRSARCPEWLRRRVPVSGQRSRLEFRTTFRR